VCVSVCVCVCVCVRARARVRLYRGWVGVVALVVAHQFLGELLLPVRRQLDVNVEQPLLVRLHHPQEAFRPDFAQGCCMIFINTHELPVVFLGRVLAGRRELHLGHGIPFEVVAHVAAEIGVVGQLLGRHLPRAVEHVRGLAEAVLLCLDHEVAGKLDGLLGWVLWVVLLGALEVVTQVLGRDAKLGANSPKSAA